ncbi:MAG TPA: methyltransferase domain-containing protein [Burkholderiaceae bacterium]|nr:methyltransferase domain-containing protein [Burkholderiaceae bacterium]
MSDTARHDAWQAGDAYEAYMGRWSRRIAPRFLEWLDPPAGSDWLDVGCGTGALSAAVLSDRAPRGLIGVEPSAGFLARARATVVDPRVEFREGDAGRLPLEAAGRDVAVSGLVLNFVPDRDAALSEMRRVLRPGGTVGFYVWDYPGGGIGFMRAFWNAAAALDPGAGELTEGRRFPFCTPPELRAMAERAGFASVEVTAIEVPTVFRDFDDYWRPFTLGAGPAPGYCASLAPDARERLRGSLEASLPRGADGSIALTARAWAVRGRAPRSA